MKKLHRIKKKTAYWFIFTRLPSKQTLQYLWKHKRLNDFFGILEKRDP